MKKYLQLTTGFILINCINLYAQSLNSNLSQVAGEYAQNYIQPLVNGFGADINSGMVNITNFSENEFHN